MTITLKFSETSPVALPSRVKLIWLSHLSSIALNNDISCSDQIGASTAVEVLAVRPARQISFLRYANVKNVGGEHRASRRRLASIQKSNCRT